MKPGHTLALASTLLLFMTGQICPQSKSDNLIIARAKKADVSALDAALPSETFSNWLVKTVGPKAKIEWEVNDCGEQSGSRVDLQRDIPMCAQAEATLSDGRKVVMMFIVGTQQKGFSKRAGGIFYLSVEYGAESRQFATLHELRDALKNTK